MQTEPEWERDRMPDPPLVAVVVVHWGSADMTMECIQSVSASEYRALKLIVVDNCPGGRVWHPAFDDDERITYLQAATNTGYTGGNNLGIRLAQDLHARYVFLLNNDAIIDRGLVTNCVAYLEEQPTVAVVTPRIYFHHKPEHIYLAGGEMDTRKAESRFVGWDERDVGQYDRQREITFAHGCALFARATVFERVGFFDERLFCYGEDVELSRRITVAGMKMVYFPQARVWHRCSSLQFDDVGVVSTTLATYYIWRNRLFSLRHYIVDRRVRGYWVFASGFLWRFVSLALKHRRMDLCGAMALGLVDAVLGRMGKREYALFRERIVRR